MLAELVTHYLMLSKVEELIISLSISIVFNSNIQSVTLQHFLKKLTDLPASKIF